MNDARNSKKNDKPSYTIDDAWGDPMLSRKVM